MSKPSVAEIPAKLHELLVPLTPEERSRAVRATMILFGDEAPEVEATTPVIRAKGRSGGASTDPRSFFDEKAPQNKGEVLAVAGRYREIVENAHTHSKADLRKVISDARRNFDDRNFARDIANARRQAGFFNLNTGRDASTLSYFGQQFVDALPDRDAALKIKRPKVAGVRKSAASTKGTK